MTMGALTSPLRDQLVEAHAGPGALAVAQPADARRQALERHALLGHADPARERLVLREELEHGLVGALDVRRITGQRHPAERALALAEQRPDEGGHEAREVEGVGDAGGLRLGADVVAVVEGDGAGRLEREHGPHVVGHGRHGARDVRRRDRRSRRAAASVERQARRHVAVERVVGGRLVGDDVEALAPAHQLRLDLGGVADKRDRCRRARRRRPAAPRQVPRRGRR